MNQDTDFTITVATKDQLTAAQRTNIIKLCSAAFEEEFEPYIANFVDPVYLLGTVGGRLVSHACWITRWMQIGQARFLRTAYVEAVATDVDWRGNGFASRIMQTLASFIQAIDSPPYEIAALSPATHSFYQRLGWQLWKGPLYGRKAGDLIAMPGEEVMVLPLAATPPFERNWPASIEWREGEVW